MAAPPAAANTNAPTATSLTAAIAPATTTTPNTATAPSAVSSQDDVPVLALREEMATLKTMVASLQEKVTSGEEHLLDANHQFLQQEAAYKQLTEQFAELWQELLPPAPPLPVSACLPVVVDPSSIVREHPPVSANTSNVPVADGPSAVEGSSEAVCVASMVEAAVESSSIASTAHE
ncbi:hypothetical protein BDR07DRAFT_1482472 [Suillus spraguei]|nr:hypothetical protein BDR07DRAFT_1482472 [Suillus spraguei]